MTRWNSTHYNNVTDHIGTSRVNEINSGETNQVLRVCVFEMLIAVPDEYNIILNTNKINENEATDSLLIMVIIMLCIM